MAQNQSRSIYRHKIDHCYARLCQKFDSLKFRKFHNSRNQMTVTRSDNNPIVIMTQSNGRKYVVDSYIIIIIIESVKFLFFILSVIYLYLLFLTFN